MYEGRKTVALTSAFNYLVSTANGQSNIMIPQTVLIGLVVAFVGYILQQRSWRHNKKEEVRQREFDACMEIIEALGRAIDKRILAIAEFVGHLNKGEVSIDEFQDYRSSVRDWMHEFSSFKSKIYHYFGRERMLEFEDSVHSSLRQVSDIALRTHRYGIDNLSSKHLDEHRSCASRLDLARFISYKYLLELNEMTANEETGRISLYDNVDAGSLDLISRTYLIQRLLGMRS